MIQHQLVKINIKTYRSFLSDHTFISGYITPPIIILENIILYYYFFQARTGQKSSKKNLMNCLELISE